MKFVGAFVFALMLAAAFGAAILPNQKSQEELYQELYQDLYQDYLRDRRSSYPSAYYAPPPCASAPIPSAPVFHLPPAPHVPTFAPAIPHLGYNTFSIPQYRDADESEMMSFSDMDQMQGEAMAHQAMFEAPGHMPMARYAYGPGPSIAALPAIAPAFGPSSASASAAAASAAASAAALAASPAIGVFPNANIGGCSVPLLLSCSPSIRSGHIVKSHGYSYGGEAYRGVDEQQQNHDAQQDPTHEHLLHAHDAAPSSLHQ